MSFHPYKCFRTFTVWKHFLKDAILCSQYRAAKLVIGEQLSLYFGIGGYVSAHSRQEEWGSSVLPETGRCCKQFPTDHAG